MEERLAQRWDEEVERLAAEREAQGWMQVTGSAFTFLAGALIIVATGGAAAPFVAVPMVFAASNMAEGIQNVYYGTRGDIASFARSVAGSAIAGRRSEDLPSSPLSDLAVMGLGFAVGRKKVTTRLGRASGGTGKAAKSFGSGKSGASQILKGDTKAIINMSKIS